MLIYLQHARKGGNTVLNRLMGEVGMDKDIASLKRMNGKFQWLNQLMGEKARELAEEIKLDEVDLRGLEEEVDDLEESLFRKMEQSIKLILFFTNIWVFECSTSGSPVQRSRKLMYGLSVDAAIMLLEEKKNDRGSNVTRVMSDLSIGD